MSFLLFATCSGPDVEFIEEILGQVGARHAKMKLNVSFFPYLGNALLWSLEKSIKEDLTAEHRESWEEVYEAISGEIVKAILNNS
jgi:hemoglobin-like flavoprotein